MRIKVRMMNLLLVAALVIGGFGFGVASRAQSGAGTFADPAFAAVWGRTDSLVANGTVSRSYYWGPTPGEVKEEPFSDAPGGKRLVQYFEKSRMEINDPAADKSSRFYVTNGLLTVELVSGKIQIGNTKYEQRAPAEINLASDADDATAPTYASFSKLMITTTNKVGSSVGDYISRDGTVGPSKTEQLQPDAAISYYEPATGHNIAAPIWSFLNATGSVSTTGGIITETLSSPWFYATGYPITEPYWADVKIGGARQPVLIQLFERRVVTYAPNLAEAYRVQVGNIGQHYYDWRYKNVGVPASTPTPTAAPAPPTPAPGSGLPGGNQGNNMDVKVAFAKPAVAHSEEQTVLVTTLPKSHITLICTDAQQGRFNNACTNDGHGNTDVNGAWAFTWTLSPSTPTGTFTVTVIASQGAEKHGYTSAAFVVK